jgi:hypothetical protein
VVFAWSAVIILATVGFLGGVVWFWIQSNKVHPDPANAEKEVPPVVERVVSRFPSPTEDEALKMVKSGLQVHEPAKVAAFFRLGTATPEQVIDFLRDMKKTDGTISRYDWLSSMDANGLLLDGVVVNSIHEGEQRNRLALLTPDEKGKWFIDFEAFARLVKPSWKELLENPSAQGTVRVIVAKDSYFNGPFRDETQWTCYGMVTPDAEGVMMGYCRKDTPQAAAMARINASKDLQEGKRAVNRATLEIRRVVGAEGRQFEITRVIAEDWVRAAKAFDEVSK